MKEKENGSMTVESVNLFTCISVCYDLGGYSGADDPVSG